MTTQTATYMENETTTTPDTLLRRLLQADGALTGLTGLILLATNGKIQEVMGLSSPWVLVEIGVFFLLYDGLLFWIAGQRPIDARKVYVTISMNTLWVIGSIGVILADPLGLSVEGKWLVALVAVAAGLFADLQYFGLRRMKKAG